MEKALMETVPTPRLAISDDAGRVRAALIEQGLETLVIANGLSRDEKYEAIGRSFTHIIHTLGLDLSDDSLRDTPHRIARMYVDEIFSGLDYTRFPKATAIDNKMGVDEMVKVEDVSVVSTCEHHFITIDGLASAAYIPRGRIIGLSKINRIVRFFAQRPQVQERLTRQIMVALQTLLETDDVGVTIKATHYCVKALGVMDSTSQTRTTSLGGLFKTDARTRRDFLG